MRTMLVRAVVAAALLVLSLQVVPASRAAAPPGTAAAWAMNASIIEACSCQMFCPCYFSTRPSAGHDGHGESGHYCRFNMGYKINKGWSGEWAEVTFDPTVTKEQRDAIAPILLQHVYPVKWKTFTLGAVTPTEGAARAACRR